MLIGLDPPQAEAAPSDAELIEAVAATFDDPLAFVYYNFPWGKAGTALAAEDGPDIWQVRVLTIIRDHIQAGGELQEALRIAVASGHGIGKTALIAWLIIWFISTRHAPQIVVTANTQAQLTGKTWREVAKWHKLARNGRWFQWTATRFYMKSDPETWFAQATPWSVQKAEAFAGTHEKYVLIIFDEASAIDDIIWETVEGAQTTAAVYWIAFGNPTRNTGRFREAFGKFRHRWKCLQVDSRTAKQANRKQLDQWVEDYGEDSDFVRVRVKGQFPRASSMQFISTEDVENAQRREMDWEAAEDFPLLLGVDVARFGDDQTVIIARQGRCSRIIQKARGLNTMTVAARVAELIRELNPVLTFIDVVGIGAGVVDRLEQLGFGEQIMAVNAGERAAEDQKFANKRAEMYCRLRDWLGVGGGCIPDDQELHDDLIGPEYGFDSKQRYQIERKDDMKARGLPSPDTSDAYALTFAETVQSTQRAKELGAVARLLQGLGSPGIIPGRSFMSR